ncbi:MAG TPA: hypothetical protein VMF89_18065 [Polyangiales bacterium]|nr:hypothetical protein [Polyangiales bacterium]
MTYIPPSGPLPIGGVIDDALRLYRSMLSRAWLLSCGFSLALACFSFVLFLHLRDYATPASQSPAAAMQSLQLMLSALTSAPILSLYILVTLLTFALYGSLMTYADAVARGDHAFSLVQACAVGFRRLPGIVLASLIFGVAVGAGFLVLIVPGFWLWGRLQLWMAAMFVENATALGSLGSSWSLTKGNWWRGTTIFSVAVIMILVISIVFSMVAGAIAGVLRLSVTDAQILVQLASVIANTVTYPFFAATWLSMHRDFKLRREGGDLAARAGVLA